jgi:2-polyprenyl-6-methoxyphenol hydroxylase-like FAD-dependent oxidoreductase
MLGLLLARAGVPVVVLEKHADFLRDFRGDTIHPSTLEILAELGLADRFLELPHSEVSHLGMRLPSGVGMDMDFRRLPTQFKFIAFVPQWEFLEFVTREAARYMTFTLLREADVTDLVMEDGRVAGVRYRDATGAEQEVRADLTVGADGRTSRVRDAAGLPLIDTDAESVELRLQPGHFFALINRRDYWQVAYVIPKGALEEVRAGGLDAFRASFADGVPELADRALEITDWDQVKLLTVRADRLRRWYGPGVLCIGDAAHAMSPIAGVGINVAIQDAVEAANLLWKPLLRGAAGVRDLARVQRRRELSVRVIQGFQGILQENILRPTLGSTDRVQLPWFVLSGMRLPVLRDLPARFIALGIRRPHVTTPAITAGR